MWERNINWLPLVHTPSRDRTYNPGMCSDQEWNQWLLASQTNTQPTELVRAGVAFLIVKGRSGSRVQWLLLTVFFLSPSSFSCVVTEVCFSACVQLVFWQRFSWAAEVKHANEWTNTLLVFADWLCAVALLQHLPRLLLSLGPNLRWNLRSSQFFSNCVWF